MTKKYTLTFGELLIRYSPDVDGLWLANNQMNVYIGGAESNVAIALAKWEGCVQYISALPDNALSKQVLQYLENGNVDVSKTLLTSPLGRIGSFYLPSGSDMKGSKTIYDRDNSSFSALKEDMLDWDKVFVDVDWLHVTSITAALNPGLAELLLIMLQQAKKRGITVSLDLNFRPQLWQFGKTPKEVMLPMMQYIDLLMGNIWAVNQMLGIPIGTPDVTNKELLFKQTDQICNTMFHVFPSLRYIANTFRMETEGGLEYYAMLSNPKSSVFSPTLSTDNVLDKVGSGDCFLAGIIHGIKNNYSLQQTVNFASAAAFLKMFISGDHTSSTIIDIEKKVAEMTATLYL